MSAAIAALQAAIRAESEAHLAVRECCATGRGDYTTLHAALVAARAVSDAAAAAVPDEDIAAEA